MKQESIVTLVIKGNEHEFIVSRNTTCDDVINMAKKNVKITTLEDECKYTVFECSFGIAKKLPGNTKILKRIRSWGVNTHILEMKIDKMASKMAAISRAKGTIKRLRTLIGKNELKTEEKLNFKSNSDMDMAFIDKSSTFAKNTTFIRTVKHEQSMLSSIDDSLRGRTPGDGMEHSSYISFQSTLVVSENYDNINIEMDEKRTLNTGFVSDNYSKYEEDQFYERFDLNECMLYNNDLRDERVSGIENDYQYEGADIIELDKTFIETDRNIRDLNECFIYEDDDFSANEEESAFEDDSDCESISELDRNILEVQEISTTARFIKIKDAFNKVKLNTCLSEDELMESFMQTFIQTGDIDEGVESDCSDVM